MKIYCSCLILPLCLPILFSSAFLGSSSSLGTEKFLIQTLLLHALENRGSLSVTPATWAVLPTSYSQAYLAVGVVCECRAL